MTAEAGHANGEGGGGGGGEGGGGSGSELNGRCGVVVDFGHTESRFDLSQPSGKVWVVSSARYTVKLDPDPDSDSEGSSSGTRPGPSDGEGEGEAAARLVQVRPSEVKLEPATAEPTNAEPATAGLAITEGETAGGTAGETVEGTAGGTVGGAVDGGEGEGEDTGREYASRSTPIYEALVQYLGMIGCVEPTMAPDHWLHTNHPHSGLRATAATVAGPLPFIGGPQVS